MFFLSNLNYFIYTLFDRYRCPFKLQINTIQFRSVPISYKILNNFFISCISGHCTKKQINFVLNELFPENYVCTEEIQGMTGFYEKYLRKLKCFFFLFLHLVTRGVQIVGTRWRNNYRTTWIYIYIYLFNIVR